MPYVGVVMRRAPALVLLLGLLGGLGASWVHEVQHATEWAEARTSHAADRHHADGDVAQVPCANVDAHALDCAVCSGLSLAVLDRATPADLTADAGLLAWAEAAHAAYRRAVAPARGPPAIA